MNSFLLWQAFFGNYGKGKKKKNMYVGQIIPGVHVTWQISKGSCAYITSHKYQSSISTNSSAIIFIAFCLVSFAGKCGRCLSDQNLALHDHRGQNSIQQKYALHFFIFKRSGGRVAGWAAGYFVIVQVVVFVVFFSGAVAVKCGFFHQSLPGQL